MGGLESSRQKPVKRSGIQAAFSYVMEVCGTIRLKTKLKQTSLLCETSAASKGKSVPDVPDS